LQEFSRLEVWGDEGKLAGVYLLESVTPEVDLPNLIDTGKEKTASTVSYMRQTGSNGIPLSKSQLVQLASGPYNDPMAPQLWDKPQLRKFLEQHGINNPEDLNNPKKARTIRLAAKKKLRHLKKSRYAP